MGVAAAVVGAGPCVVCLYKANLVALKIGVSSGALHSAGDPVHYDYSRMYLKTAACACPEQVLCVQRNKTPVQERSEHLWRRAAPRRLL